MRTLGSSVLNINHSFVDINTFMRYYRDEQVDDLQKDYEWVSWTHLLTRFFTFHTAVYQSMSDVPRIRSLSVINTFDTDRVFVICFSNTLLTRLTTLPGILAFFPKLYVWRFRCLPPSWESVAGLEFPMIRRLVRNTRDASVGREFANKQNLKGVARFRRT